MAGALVSTVTGYVAKDPEAKANGPVTFSVPVSKGKDKPTTWVRVTCWGKTAEFVAQYVKKGSLVTCSGDIELREFDGKQGKMQSLELNAQSVQSFRTGEPAQSARPTQSYQPAPSDEDIPF